MDEQGRNDRIRVLFCCMGNICRSPTAEGVFRALVEREGLAEYFEIDSAGTHAYHVGKPPDERAARAAERRGIDLSGIRARRVCAEDFESFDYILAMDRENLEELQAACPEEYRGRLRLFLSFVRNPVAREVPDPYYGGTGGFERVLSLVEEGSRALLEALRRRHGLPEGGAARGMQARFGL